VKYFPKECILPLEELKVLCEEWKKVLGLENWETSVVIQRDHNLDSAGRCDWQNGGQKAVIRILDHIDWEKVHNGFKQFMEKTLIHELLHCKFGILDSYEVDTVEDALHEQIIDTLANALVGLKREPNVDNE